MSRRSEAAQGVKPASAKQVTLAHGFDWRELVGVGRVGITVEQNGTRKLTAQPTVGRTHQIAEAFVYASLDAGDMDDITDGVPESCWVTLNDEGQYVTAGGIVIGALDDEQADALAQDGDDDDADDDES